MPTTRTIDASVEPITLAQAKLHLRVDSSDEDALITALIKATRMAAEFALQRTLLQSTWRLTQDGFTEALRLQYPRVIAVTALQYLDDAGVLQALDPADYTVDAISEPGYVVPASGKSWPTTAAQVNAVTVTYTAGYGTDPAAVPEPVKQWILLHIAHYYRNREAATAERQPLPFADGLLDPYRIWLL